MDEKTIAVLRELRDWHAERSQRISRTLGGIYAGFTPRPFDQVEEGRLHERFAAALEEVLP
ncbi:MAG TPA: hypothetical protein VIM61_00550 [Chthoniobacterales bacterium]